MSVALGVITSAEVRWECVYSIVQASQAGAFEQFRIVPSGALLDDSRNAVVRWFLTETTCDKLLFVDADVAFLPSDVDRLAADDLDCVSGVYYNIFDGVLKPVVRLLPETEINDDPVAEVWGVGAGCLMVTRQLYEKMAAEYPEPVPWFHRPLLDGVHVGEDFGFCQRVHELGSKVHVDLRVQVSHYKTVRLTGPTLGDRLARS